MRLSQLAGAILILQTISHQTDATFLLAKPSLLLARSKSTSTTTTTTIPPPPAASVDGAIDQEEATEIGLDELAEETEQLAKSKRINLANYQFEPTGNGQSASDDEPLRWAHDRRLFVMDLLRMLHEKYGKQTTGETISSKADRHQPLTSGSRRPMMSQLLEAISADGDIRRLTDWLQNSFNLASMGELTTQFVVSKLGSVNCAALFQPDNRDSLVPRFLLFNEHFVDVPYELPATPSAAECLGLARFDPLRKTVVLVHGYLTGYTLVDGMTNIKNRLLDLNRLANERALAAFLDASRSNGTYALAGDLETKLRRQKYNVIIVDWFSGANPVPRANYIQAAANARAVGELIAQFLLNLANQCRTPSTNLQIIAHSLGK